MEPAAGNVSVTSMVSSPFRKSMSIIGRIPLLVMLLVILLPDGPTGSAMAGPVENSRSRLQADRWSWRSSMIKPTP